MHILQHYEVKVVVVANDAAVLSRVAIACARKLGIPSVFIQHGVTANHPRTVLQVTRDAWMAFHNSDCMNLVRITTHSRAWMFLLSSFLSTLVHRYHGGHSGCDVICVTGKRTRDLLTKQGVPETHIIITGQPRFDEIMRLQGSRSNLRGMLGIPADVTTVALLTQAFVEDGKWRPSQRERFLKTVVSALDGLDRTMLLIKPHPREDVQVYQRMVGNLRMCTVHGLPTVKIVQDRSSAEIIAISDIVVTVSSTTIFEALMLKKPVISLCLFREPDLTGTIRDGAILCATNKEELRHWILSVVRGAIPQDLVERMQAAAESHVYVPPSGSAALTASVILRVAQGLTKNGLPAVTGRW